MKAAALKKMFEQRFNEETGCWEKIWIGNGGVVETRAGRENFWKGIRFSDEQMAKTMASIPSPHPP